MVSSHHRRHQNPTSSSSPSSSTQPNLDFLSPSAPHPYPNLLQNPSSTAIADGQNSNSAVEPFQQDAYLSNSSHLAREEVLRRRSHNLKQLARVYRNHYWSMMEDIKAKCRDYVWKYGLSPYMEDDERRIQREEVNPLCAFYGCKLKAMALTRFCHLHILSDLKQVMYKPCEYVIKSAQAGPITCGRPILRARAPAFCNVHLQKANRAQKKAGLHISSSSKLAPKFHVILAEYVHQIQAKRRAVVKENRHSVVVNRESCK
ncbi:uncharacterized protein LOC130775895 [Actinidia eriantha]|uniref:uncharacterized protein LOC130775895 n=1 Tax=Actinidia eriantha TaxID=165200 RepID=UPI0025908300|nr:uncharacterized protein LOC130775895 [Actinidia eriantha]